LRRAASLRNVDHDRIAGARVHVVREQLAAQPAHLDAHDRVDVGVEVGAAIEDFHAERVALQSCRFARQRRFDDVSQQALLARRVAQLVGPEQALELVADRTLLRFTEAHAFAGRGLVA
jgi:hypothetical protein